MCAVEQCATQHVAQPRLLFEKPHPQTPRQNPHTPHLTLLCVLLLLACMCLCGAHPPTTTQHQPYNATQQACAGLPESGVCDERTWLALLGPEATPEDLDEVSWRSYNMLCYICNVPCCSSDLLGVQWLWSCCCFITHPFACHSQPLPTPCRFHFAPPPPHPKHTYTKLLRQIRGDESMYEDDMSAPHEGAVWLVGEQRWSKPPTSQQH